MVTLFSSLSLVNVRLLNDGLFVVLFPSDAIVEALPLHYIWYSVSLLSLAYFFLSTSLLANLGSFFSYGTASFFFSYFGKFLTVVWRFTKFVFDLSLQGRAF